MSRTHSTRRTGWIATLLAVVAALGIIAVPTSMAYLQDSSSSSGVTLTTGSADLQIIPGVGGAPALLPGRTSRLNTLAPDTITNTGSVPLRLSARATASPAGSIASNLAYVISVSPSVCGSSDEQVMWSGTIAAGSSPVPYPVLAPGETQKLCVSYGLLTTAPASTQNGPATTSTITVTGDQVAP